MKAAVMSMQPHRRPAEKMARNADEVCVPEAARFEEVKLAFLRSCDAALRGDVVFGHPTARNIFTTV
jgi:hypothetical protein